jgi:hypothetical protein
MARRRMAFGGLERPRALGLAASSHLLIATRRAGQSRQDRRSRRTSSTWSTTYVCRVCVPAKRPRQRVQGWAGPESTHVRTRRSLSRGTPSRALAWSPKACRSTSGSLICPVRESETAGIIPAYGRCRRTPTYQWVRSTSSRDVALSTRRLQVSSVEVSVASICCRLAAGI